MSAPDSTRTAGSAARSPTAPTTPTRPSARSSASPCSRTRSLPPTSTRPWPSSRTSLFALDRVLRHHLERALEASLTSYQVHDRRDPQTSVANARDRLDEAANHIYLAGLAMSAARAEIADQGHDNTRCRGDPMNDTTAALLPEALDYAKRGWFVFPLVPGTKRPACPAHPAARCDRSDPWCRHGHTSWEQRATQNPDRIRRAWSNRPYGIGIACGPPGCWSSTPTSPNPASQPPRAAGPVRMCSPSWSATGRSPTPTPCRPRPAVSTATTAPRRRLQLGNTACRLGELIDTRGHGGYVVAPPTGRRRPRLPRSSATDPAPSCRPGSSTCSTTRTASRSLRPTGHPRPESPPAGRGHPAAGPLRGRRAGR